MDVNKVVFSIPSLVCNVSQQQNPKMWGFLNVREFITGAKHTFKVIMRFHLEQYLFY